MQLNRAVSRRPRVPEAVRGQQIRTARRAGRARQVAGGRRMPHSTRPVPRRRPQAGRPPAFDVVHVHCIVAAGLLSDRPAPACSCICCDICDWAVQGLSLLSLAEPMVRVCSRPTARPSLGPIVAVPHHDVAGVSSWQVHDDALIQGLACRSSTCPLSSGGGTSAVGAPSNSCTRVDSRRVISCQGRSSIMRREKDGRTEFGVV
jgi:hypothetical protein